MSLNIRVENVIQVLIAGVWYDTPDGLDVDAYELVEGELLVSNGGGFGFRTSEGSFLYGPVSSIQAVRTKPRGDGEDDAP